MQLKVGTNIYYVYNDGVMVVGSITRIEDSTAYILWDGHDDSWAYDTRRDSFWECIVTECT